MRFSRNRLEQPSRIRYYCYFLFCYYFHTTRKIQMGRTAESYRSNYLSIYPRPSPRPVETTSPNSPGSETYLSNAPTTLYPSTTPTKTPSPRLVTYSRTRRSLQIRIQCTCDSHCLSSIPPSRSCVSQRIPSTLSQTPVDAPLRLASIVFADPTDLHYRCCASDDYCFDDDYA